MNTYATLYFRDWRSAVSLLHKNRTKIIGLVCEQKALSSTRVSSLIFVAAQKLFSVV